MIKLILGIQLVGVLGGTVLDKERLKHWSMFITIINMLFSLIVLITFNQNSNELQYRSSLHFGDIYISLGLDGISTSLIVLTTVLFPIILLIEDSKESKDNLITILLIEFILIIIFVTNDIGLFFIMFELSLIPLILFIGRFGASPNRSRKIEASYRIFLYTLLGSLCMLISILLLHTSYKTTNNELLYFLIHNNQQDFLNLHTLVWIFFIISFLIKIPSFPFHTWLPHAHTEASTRGSVILAALILKLGTYAILRYLLPYFDSLNLYFSPIIYVLGLLSVYYGSLITLRQIDLKRVIAYSSIVHMGICLLGLFSLSYIGIIGGIYTMISHAFISSGLFILIGFLYNRYHTRFISYYRGLSITMPLFSTLFLLFSFANMALPLTSAFIGEILILMGVLENNLLLAIFTGFGIFLSSIYSIYLVNRVIFGKLSPYLLQYNDIYKSEFFTILPLFIFVFLFGFYTNPIIDLINLDVLKLI